MRSTVQILEDINRQLSWDRRINAKNIIVEMIDHTAILSGTVGSYMQRKAAESDVMVIDGVSEVKNHLQIQRSAGLKGPTDEQITWNIKSILKLNAAFNDSNIEISSQNGVIHLQGSVDEYWKKLHAEEVIFDVPGVYEVINTLTVVPTKVPLDQSIASSILTAFKRIGSIDLNSVSIEVSGGRVVLKGKVSDWHSYTAAYNAAKYTRGVTDLTNMLIIA